MLKRRFNITLLDFKWEPIIRNVKRQAIPRSGELIYVKELTKYFEVLNVVHDFSNTKETFIVVKEYFRELKQM